MAPGSQSRPLAEQGGVGAARLQQHVQPRKGSCAPTAPGAPAPHPNTLSCLSPARGPVLCPRPCPLPAAPVPVLVPCPQPRPSTASPAAVTPAGLGAAGPTACLLFPAQSLRFASSGRFTLLLLSLGIKSLEKAAGRPSVPGTEGSGCAQPGRWNLAQGDEERSQPPCTSDLGCRGKPTRGDVPGLAMHQPHLNVQTPNPSQAGRNPKIIRMRPPPGSSPRPVGPRCRGCTPARAGPGFPGTGAAR